MKHVNYTCDFCGVVWSENEAKTSIQVLSREADTLKGFALIKEWSHVCASCFLNVESKIKSMKSLSSAINDEVKFERALDAGGQQKD